MIQRILVPILLGAALASGAWLLYQRTQSTPTPAEVAPSPTPVPTATPVAAVAVEVEGQFRLAGTAVGDPTSYAAIELPDGTSHLYRADSDVPGLGKLVEIYPDRVVLHGPEGETTLSLKPAATATSDRRRLKSASTPPPEARSDSDDIPLESEPSDAPDPQAF